MKVLPLKTQKNAPKMKKKKKKKPTNGVHPYKLLHGFVGLAYHQGKDIVFRLIIEYSSLRDFYRPLGNNNNNNNNNRSFFFI